MHAAGPDVRRASKTPVDELMAFEVATRDLVGVALRSMQRLDGEVSLPQFRLLAALQDHGRCTCTQVAQSLGLAGSSVTRLGDRLAASGHVLRGAEPANRSVVTLELTDKGRKLVKQVIARRRRELGRVLDRLAPAERAACVQGLRSLHEQLGERDATEPRPRLPL
ncbi:MAG: MarR family transcriptional regulator [Frankiales bacterium]|nr:MarR family transcriptional regulator [Frankiales bacterium]